MNPYVFAAGIAIALYIVAATRRAGHRHRILLYALLLASFPAYYWGFAVYASDYDALLAEVATSLVFLALAGLAWRVNARTGLWLLAAGYLGHAAYDIVHEAIFTNPGTPPWWPEFCGSIDALLGLYLVALAVPRRRTASPAVRD